MGVRGGDEDALGRHTGELLGLDLGRIRNVARDHAGIHHDERDGRGAVVEHEAAGVQFIVNMAGSAIVEIAVNGNAQPRRDVAGGPARAELARLLGRRGGYGRLRGQLQSGQAQPKRAKHGLSF